MDGKSRNIFYYTFLDFLPESRSKYIRKKTQFWSTKYSASNQGVLDQQNQFASPFASTKSDSKEKGNNINDWIEYFQNKSPFQLFFPS